jgi:redox-sensitive bicupin YhaK (pirin superfamily)
LRSVRAAGAASLWAPPITRSGKRAQAGGGLPDRICYGLLGIVTTSFTFELEYRMMTRLRPFEPDEVRKIRDGLWPYQFRAWPWGRVKEPDMALRDAGIDAAEMVIRTPIRDLGEFKVRRAFPTPHRRSVGPFVFFDQLGPMVMAAGQGLDVPPHPHIGLATVTYLMSGSLLHRDSLGTVQEVRPGEVNWMTAGGGIVHSERTPAAERATGATLSGFQVWLGLPAAKEDVAPSFSHYAAASLPRAESEGVSLTLIAGSSDGMVSPVATYSDLVYLELRLMPDARYRVSAEHVERCLYVISGSVTVEGEDGGFFADELVVLKPGREIVIRASEAAHVILAGGEPFPEPRHVYWNFVSSSRDRIEQAKEDWREGRFAEVPGERESIPLPPDPPKWVRYP